MRAPGAWRSPASPRSCSVSSWIIDRPVAPTGWPFDTSPPEMLIGRSPPSAVAPDATYAPPWPIGQKPSISAW